MAKMISEKKAFENLAIAIIWQATEDYKEAEQMSEAGKKRRRAEIEKFFNSKWGKTLSFNNGDYVLNRVKKELAEKESEE